MPVGKVGQHVVEVLSAIAPVAKVGQDVIEVLWAQPTASPTTPTGAGVSQDVVEVLIAISSPKALVSMDVIEVLMTGDGATSSGGSGGTRIYGHVD